MTLRFGRMADAALGVEVFMNVTPNDMRAGLMEGLPALRREFETNGTEEDKLCMRYVLDMEAGSCEVVFPNGDLMMDCVPSTGAGTGGVAEGRLVSSVGGEQRGKRLDDFFNHPKARAAHLELAEVGMRAIGL